MNKHLASHSDKLDSAIHILKYHIKEVRSKKNASEFIDSVITKIKPLIGLIQPGIIQEYETDKSNHLKKYQHFKDKTLAEIKESFVILKQRLCNEGLLTNSVILRQTCIIDSIFESRLENEKAFEIINNEGISEWICTICGDNKRSHRVYVFPSYHEGLFREVCCLCDKIFQLGRKDLIIDLAEIRTFEKWQHSTISENDLKYKSEEIDRYIFAPSLFELFKLNDITYFQNQGSDVPPWVAWDILYSAEWAVKEAARDFLRKKTLNYDSPEAIITSAYRLGLHALRLTVKNAVKRQDNLFSENDSLDLSKSKLKCNSMTFIHERIDKALELVLRDIDKISDSCRAEPDYVLYPVSIKLFFDDYYDEFRLCLKVEYASNIYQIIQLHKFRDNIDNDSGDDISNKIYIFIQKLIQNPNQFTKLNYLQSVKVNAKKHLHKVGIAEILYELFIINKTGNSVALQSNHIDLTEKPKIKLNQLQNYLDTLKHVRWEK